MGAASAAQDAGGTNATAGFGLHEVMGIALVVFFTMPLVLTHISGFEIQSAMVLAPLLLPVIAQLRMTVTVSMLVSAVLLSILGIIYVGVIHTGQLSLRSVLSLLFFYLPYTYYFIGWRFIKSELALARLLRVVSITASVLGIAVLGKLTVNGEYIRVFGCIDDRCGAYLWGDFLGLPIYATFGVNSLAAIYCLLAVICAGHVVFHRMDRWKWLELAGALCLMSLVVGSASRSAVLSLLVGVLILAFFYQNRNQRAKVIGLSVIAVTGIVISLSGVASGIFEQYLGYRMDATMDLIADGDMQGASSNRVDLFLTAIEQIIDSPIFGTGFQGYGFSDVGYNIASSSAHLQALTIIWKTGLLAAGCLFYFYFRSLAVFAEFFRHAQVPLVRNVCLALIVTVLVQSLVWDVVLVPWIGGLLMFTLGAAQGIVERNRGFSAHGQKRRKVRKTARKAQPMQPSVQRRGRDGVQLSASNGMQMTKPLPILTGTQQSATQCQIGNPATSRHARISADLNASIGINTDPERAPMHLNLLTTRTVHPQSFLPDEDLMQPTIYSGALPSGAGKTDPRDPAH